MTPAERAALRRLAGARSTPQSLARRARIVLACADGLSDAAAARRTGTSRTTVTRWRERFAQSGIDALSDRPRPGRPRVITEADLHRLNATRLSPPPPTGWTTRSLATQTGLSQSTVSRLLRQPSPPEPQPRSTTPQPQPRPPHPPRSATPPPEPRTTRPAPLPPGPREADPRPLPHEARPGPLPPEPNEARPGPLPPEPHGAHPRPLPPEPRLAGLGREREPSERRRETGEGRQATGERRRNIREHRWETGERRRDGGRHRTETRERRRDAGERRREAGERRGTYDSVWTRVGPRLADVVVYALRAEIAGGRYHAGERITEAALAARLGVSRGPIRDALRVLAEDGLLELLPKRGAVIPRPRIPDIMETYATRAVLGSLLVRRVAARDPAVLGPVGAALADVRSAARRDDIRGTADADLRFQDAIAHAADLPRTSRFFTRLTMQLRMFVAVLQLDYTPSRDFMVDQNTAIFDALCDQSESRAASRWRVKVEHAVRTMVDAIPGEHFDQDTWHTMTAAGR